MRAGRALADVLHDRVAMPLAVGEREQHLEDDGAEREQFVGGA